MIVWVFDPVSWVRAVNRAVAAALRVVHRQRRPIRQQLAPSHAKSLPVPDRREVRLPRHAKRSGAVAVVSIARITREMAARKEIYNPGNAAAVGQRLETGIGSRLVVVGRNREIQEIRVMVGPGKIAIRSEIQSVVRPNHVAVTSVVAQRQQAAGVHSQFVANLQLRGGARHGGEKHQRTHANGSPFQINVPLSAVICLWRTP